MQLKPSQKGPVQSRQQEETSMGIQRRRYARASAASTLLAGPGLQSAHAQPLEQVKIVNGGAES